MKNRITFLIFLTAQTVLAGAPPAGQVVGWGFNYSGQATGLPTNDGPKAPNRSTGVVTIAGQVLTDVVAVSGGGDHSLALRSDSTVVSWGWSHRGTVFREGTNELIRIGDRTLHGPVTMEEQGSVTNGPVEVGGQLLSNVTAVAAGVGYSLALKDDGTVIGWGRGFMERQLNGPLPLSNVLAIAAGRTYDGTVALQRDGTVVFFWTGEPVPSGLSNVVAIAASGSREWAPLALTRDHKAEVMKVGTGVPEMQSPPGLSNVVAIAAGDGHYLALKSDGTVFGWGENTFGQATGAPTDTTPTAPAAGLAAPGGTVLSNVVAIAASQGFSVALKREGTVVAWGANHSGQIDVPSGLSGVVAIAAGWQHCLAITTNSSGLNVKR